MRRALLGAAHLCLLVIAGCGDTSRDETSGAGGGGGGGSSSGPGGATGTGGSSATGGGGLPAGCTDPAARACAGPGECVLTSPDCCLCGMPELDDMVALNANSVSGCVCEGPVCDCATQLNPNLAASCEGGMCQAWDVRQQDAYSSCTTSADCRLRDGLGCCEGCTGAEWNLVAIRVDSAPLLTAAMCGPNAACRDCAPQYPANVAAECLDGHCAVVILR